MCLARHHPLRQPSKRGSTWSRLLNRMPGTFSTNNTGRCFVARPYSATLSKAVKNSRDSCAAHTASGEGYGAHVLRDGSSTIHVTTFVQGHTSPCSASPFPLADTSVHGVVMTTRSRHWPGGNSASRAKFRLRMSRCTCRPGLFIWRTRTAKSSFSQAPAHFHPSCTTSPASMFAACARGISLVHPWYAGQKRGNNCPSAG